MASKPKAPRVRVVYDGQDLKKTGVFINNRKLQGVAHVAVAMGGAETLPQVTISLLPMYLETELNGNQSFTVHRPMVKGASTQRRNKTKGVPFHRGN